MRWPKRLLISAFAGPAIAGAGLGMIAIGGYGPCGPASDLSAAGAYLTVGFYLLLNNQFPIAALLETMGSVGKSVEWCLVFLFPPLVWSAVVFGILSAVSRLRGRR